MSYKKIYSARKGPKREYVKNAFSPFNNARKWIHIENTCREMCFVLGIVVASYCLFYIYLKLMATISNRDIVISPKYPFPAQTSSAEKGLHREGGYMLNGAIWYESLEEAQIHVNNLMTAIYNCLNGLLASFVDSVATKTKADFVASRAYDIHVRKSGKVDGNSNTNSNSNNDETEDEDEEMTQGGNDDGQVIDEEEDVTSGKDTARSKMFVEKMFFQ